MSILHNLGGKSLKDFTNQAGIYCIYGMPGSGKTTLFGGSNIRPIMLSVDQTTDGGLVAAAHNAGGMGFNLNSVQELNKVTAGLKSAAISGEITPEQYDWVVLDHVAGLHTLALNSCTQKDRDIFKVNQNMTQFRQNVAGLNVYAPANALFKSILEDIMVLKEYGFKIGIIAHQKSMSDKALLAKGISNSTPAVSINLSDTLTTWLSAKLTALIHATKEAKITPVITMPGQPKQEPLVENRYYLRLKTDNLQDIKVRTTLGTVYPSKVESPMNAPLTMNDVLAVIRGEAVMEGVEDDILTSQDAKAFAATVDEEVKEVASAPVINTPAPTIKAPVLNVPVAPAVTTPKPVTPVPAAPQNTAAPAPKAPAASLDAIHSLIEFSQKGGQ